MKEMIYLCVVMSVLGVRARCWGQAPGSWWLEATDDLQLEDRRHRGGVILDPRRGCPTLPTDGRALAWLADLSVGASE
jgi:hypothetical protein